MFFSDYWGESRKPEFDISRPADCNLSGENRYCCRKRYVISPNIFNLLIVNGIRSAYMQISSHRDIVRKYGHRYKLS